MRHLREPWIRPAGRSSLSAIADGSAQRWVQARSLVVAVIVVLGLFGTELSMAEERLIDLPQPTSQGADGLGAVLQKRRSIRAFRPQSLTLPAVARLLWAAQGITSKDGLRAAPSAGALYPLETHLVVGAVDGLPSGSYRYDPYRHALVPGSAGDRRTAIAAAALHQGWIAEAAVIFVVTAFEGRTTRKYGARGVRYVHMEVGHASQNLLLQATALGLGGTVVGAFDDDALAALLDLAEDERPLAILAVGHPAGP